MDNKYQGLQVLYDRLSPMFESYPLKYFEWNPTSQVVKEQMPCVLMLEGEDIITKRSNRKYIGYPTIRQAEVYVECWETTGDFGGVHAMDAVRALYADARQRALANDGVLAEGVVIRENKTIGPFSLGVPGVLGVRLVLIITYADQGPDF